MPINNKMSAEEVVNKRILNKIANEEVDMLNSKLVQKHMLS